MCWASVANKWSIRVDRALVCESANVSQQFSANKFQSLFMPHKALTICTRKRLLNPAEFLPGVTKLCIGVKRRESALKRGTDGHATTGVVSV